MAVEDTLYTEADIIAFKRSMRFAGTSVEGSDGKKVDYPPIGEMQATLAQMRLEVYGRRARRRVQSIIITSEGS